MQDSAHLLRTRRFLPIFVTQFLGAFNDNLFRTAMVMLVIYGIYQDPEQEATFSAIAGGLFILPFFLLSGLGRLGMWWGADRDAVVPDVLLAGKALSGGVMPVSAALCSAEAYAPLNANPLLHTSTFAGNPLAAVAAKTAVEVIAEEGLVQRSHDLGARLLPAVRAEMFQHCGHLIGDVRGLGLLIGIEFNEESRATRFIFELLERGVLASHSLNAGHVVRLTPPAVMGEAEIEWLLSAVRDSAVRLGAKFRRRSA